MLGTLSNFRSKLATPKDFCGALGREQTNYSVFMRMRGGKTGNKANFPKISLTWLSNNLCNNERLTKGYIPSLNKNNNRGKTNSAIKQKLETIKRHGKICREDFHVEGDRKEVETHIKILFSSHLFT